MPIIYITNNLLFTQIISSTLFIKDVILAIFWASLTQISLFTNSYTTETQYFIFSNLHNILQVNIG